MKKILVALIFLIIFYIALNFTLKYIPSGKINKASKEFTEENFGRKIAISNQRKHIKRHISKKYYCVRSGR